MYIYYIYAYIVDVVTRIQKHSAGGGYIEKTQWTLTAKVNMTEY